MTKRLGILDWGIGGIGIYTLVREQLGLPVTYLSDTGATPYGKMSQKELVTRVNRCIKFLKAEGVTHLVIGCNAASTAIDDLDRGDLIVEGMIDNAIDAAMRHRPARLGVIGGRRTIVSGVYRTGFASRGVGVRQRIAQPLSALIESGITDGDELHAAAAKILRPLRNCSHILLGCTHYPAVTSELSKHVSPETKFIDPAKAIVKKVAGWKLTSDCEERFYTTGSATTMRCSAKLAFGVDIFPPAFIKIGEENEDQ